nr:MAG TPA: hypothetical protein [Caudoviricetes sp.]
MTLVTELSLRGVVGAYVTFFVRKEKFSETTRHPFLIYIKLQNHAYPRIAPQISVWLQIHVKPLQFCRNLRN